MRELVGSTVQLCVGELLISTNESAGIWRTLYLFLEELRDPHAPRIIGARGIKSLNYLATLPGREDRQRQRACLRCLLQRLRERLHRRFQIANNPMRVDAPVGLCRQNKFLSRIIDGQRDRIVRPCFASAEYPNSGGAGVLDLWIGRTMAIV